MRKLIFLFILLPVLLFGQGYGHLSNVLVTADTTDVSKDVGIFMIDTSGDTLLYMGMVNYWKAIYGKNDDAIFDELLVRDDATFEARVYITSTANDSLIITGEDPTLQFIDNDDASVDKITITGVDSLLQIDGTTLVIDTDGNLIGIGTAAPSDLLEVQADAGSPAVVTLSTAELTIVDGDKLGQIDFQAPLESDGTDAILVGASIWAEADGTFGAAVNETELVFATASSETATERMRIDKAGNLGIGTTIPTALLNVSGPAGAPGAVDLSTEELTVVDGDVLGKIEFNAPLESDGTDAILVGAAIEAIAEGTFAADNNATELVFKTAASEAATQKMVITSAGDVGIGTTEPEVLLDINNNTTHTEVRIGPEATGYNAMLRFIENRAALTAQGGFIQYDGASNKFNFGVNNAGTPVTDDNIVLTIIRTNGDIGIGTTGPGTNLEIDESAVSNATEILLTIVNSDTGATGEIGQTADMVFEFAGSSTSGASWANHEAVKFSAYKEEDFWGADESDYDAGLKISTVTDGAYVLNSTFSDDDLTVVGTVQAEHLVSTDDADINDNLTVGDIIVDEASGVISHTGATLFTLTSVADIEITTTSNNEDIKLIPNGSGDIILDGHWNFNANALTSLTDNNTTLTAYATKNITVESVTFDGGTVDGVTTLAMNNQLTNTLAIGTSPFVVTSTTVNTNLNADLLDGESASAFQDVHASLTSIAGLTETNGGMLYGTADNAYAWLAAGTSNYLLQGNGAGAPSWTNAPTVAGTNITGIPLDGDFGSNGLMERTGAGTYDIATATDIAGHLTWSTNITNTTGTITVDDFAIKNNVADAMSASTDGTNLLVLTNTDEALAAETYILTLNHNEEFDATAYGDFIKCVEDANGTPGTMFTVEYDGDVTSAGNIAGITYGSNASISDAELLTLDDGTTAQILVGGGAGSAPVWGADIPTAVTIGTAYIYRAGGTDVPDADVADNITLTNITQITTKPITSLSATNWRLFYSADGAIPVELALGADGTFLESNGAAAAPAFRILAAGDIPDISATYEVQLNNEAGLYAVLSDVSQFYESGDSPTFDNVTADSVYTDTLKVDGFAELDDAEIGGAYIYRVGGTDVADGDVADNITITNISQVGDISATASEINTPLDGATTTLAEFQQLQTIDATTISANQWTALGGIAETLAAAELNLLDGETDLANQAELDAVAALVDTDDEIIAIINASPSTQIGVPAGGTGVGTLNDGGLLVGAGTGAVEVLADGLTTQILVGGGANTNPVWTTVTGTGAPVRATSPTLVTPVLGVAAATTMTITLNAVALTDGTPTDTEIDTGTGTTPGAVASGWTTYLEDNSDGVIYQVVSDGVDSWYYFTGTLAINP